MKTPNVKPKRAIALAEAARLKAARSGKKSEKSESSDVKSTPESNTQPEKKSVSDSLKTENTPNSYFY